MRILATKIAAVESPFKTDIVLAVGTKYVYRVAPGNHTLILSAQGFREVRLQSATDLRGNGTTWRFIRQPFRMGTCAPGESVRAEITIPQRGWQLVVKSDISTAHAGAVAIFIFHPKDGRVTYHYSPEHRERIWGPDRRVAGID